MSFIFLSVALSLVLLSFCFSLFLSCVFLPSLHSSCFSCLCYELKAADPDHIRDNQSAAKCAFVSAYYRLLLSSLYGVSVCTVFYFLIYLHSSVCLCVGKCTTHALSVQKYVILWYSFTCSLLHSFIFLICHVCHIHLPYWNCQTG